MSNTFNKTLNSKMSAEVKNTVRETTHESVCRCDRSYYDYLRDMRAENLDDSCDYCTAFMLA